MGIIVKNVSDRPHYDPVEAGSYPAVCYSMIVTGTTYNQMFGNSSTKVVLQWELPTETIDVDGIEKPRAISATYTLSLNEKANLRKILESWRGKAFTDDDLRQGFDISKVVGTACLLNIIVDENHDERAFNKVTGVGKLPKGMPAPEAYNEQVIFDIRDKDTPLSAMDKLPEWIQERIKESDEYRARVKSSADDAPIAETEDLPF